MSTILTMFVLTVLSGVTTLSSNMIYAHTRVPTPMKCLVASVNLVHVQGSSGAPLVSHQPPMYHVLESC